MPLYFINFTAAGGMSMDADDKDQAEFEALTYIRDSFPDLNDVEIVDIKEI